MADYYVGNDSFGNAGSDAANGLSFANRKATLTAAMALLTTAGDRLIITAPATFPLTVTAQTLAISGGSTSPIVVTGARSLDGVVDGSIAYLTGNAAAASVFLDGGAAKSHWYFMDLDITGCTSHGVNFTAATAGHMRFIRCRFRSNTGYGAVALGTGYSFVNCQMDVNGGGGVSCRGLVSGCRINGNTGLGVLGNATSGVAVISGCSIYGNTSHGVQLTLSATGSIQFGVVKNNTINGNGGSAIVIDQDDSASVNQIINNILSNHASGYGISLASGAAIMTPERNHYHGNLGLLNNITVPSWWSELATTGDPLFRDAAAGDFALAAATPAVGADGIVRGAMERLVAAAAAGQPIMSALMRVGRRRWR